MIKKTVFVLGVGAGLVLGIIGTLGFEVAWSVFVRLDRIEQFLTVISRGGQ